MIQGTTPTHVFKLPIETSLLDKIRITYKQLGNVVLEKTEADLTKSGKELKYKLTQEETLRFSTQGLVEIQVKVLTVSGTVLASPIQSFSVQRILNTEVLI